MDSQSVRINKAHSPHSGQSRCASILKWRLYFIWLRGCLCDFQRRPGANEITGQRRWATGSDSEGSPYAQTGVIELIEFISAVGKSRIDAAGRNPDSFAHDCAQKAA